MNSRAHICVRNLLMFERIRTFMSLINIPVSLLILFVFFKGFRLKQTPTDVWSIRERLALASSVSRSGDQNWLVPQTSQQKNTEAIAFDINLNV